MNPAVGKRFPQRSSECSTNIIADVTVAGQEFRLVARTLEAASGGNTRNSPDWRCQHGLSLSNVKTAGRAQSETTNCSASGFCNCKQCCNVKDAEPGYRARAGPGREREAEEKGNLERNLYPLKKTEGEDR